MEVGTDGTLTSVTAGARRAGAIPLAGPVIPGMPDAHCHAFQRAMAGLAERAQPGRDSFWTWRETMYGFVESLTPEHVEIIAAALYADLVKHGYTSVAEFHYVHHQPDGTPYEDPSELSSRIIEAALRVGIGITHLPVLYAYGGFDEKPLAGAQRRFQTEPDQLLRMVDALGQRYGGHPLVRLGVAPHSLRAVSPPMLDVVVNGVRAMDPKSPIHIHVAEQRLEVEQCAKWRGKRPVEWVLGNHPVDSSWCLVHATHLTHDETQALARRRVTVGLCPTTEANLGDGLFPLRRFLDAGGRYAIGSDSNVSVSVAEELRWLEYGQRLRDEVRLVAATDEHPSTGEALYRTALEGGRRALAQPIGRIAPGCRADLVVLDPENPGLVGRENERLLDGFIFGCAGNPVRDVLIAGAWVLREGRHASEEEFCSRFREAMADLLG